MDIDEVAVKRIRSERGWTQQHLADACALSLRTIQRVEKEGAGSRETLMSLCAVFEVDQSHLQNASSSVHSAISSMPASSRVWALGISALFGGITGAFLMFFIMKF